MNTDRSENNSFIAYNDEKEVEEIVAEVDNEEKVNIEIAKEKVDEPIDDISSVAFTESFNEKEKEQNVYRVCNNIKKNRKKRK